MMLTVEADAKTGHMQKEDVQRISQERSTEEERQAPPYTPYWMPSAYSGMTSPPQLGPQPPPPQYSPYPDAVNGIPGCSTVHVISIASSLGPEPTSMFCPHCRMSITTKTSCFPSCTNHCCAFFFCLIGLWPCMPFAYCCFNNIIHHCPNCKSNIGVYAP
ncbi:cell death-inducing p53-target protein 1-like isoform X2 [Cephus cinctus]|uniref:Cell death-inducing p53-target protein 1-like isoform X2 n=1 Tax=Cephus cinctus TaxID=211228 RepID=A0AAJ7RI79_CEPCN|nr:cell death-inducing p53-target protein 1-like isoform X2 [Cephus cinctus]